MTEPEIIKVFGGPGTGKTTTMVTNNNIENYKGILERKLEENPISDVMLIAYTRSAADEAKKRLAKTTRYSQKDLDKRVTTIHSLTMGMTGIYPNNIVEIRNVPDKYHFCNERDIVYSYDDTDEDDMMDIPDDPGHQFFQIVSWLKSSLLPPEEWQQCPISHVWKNNDYDFVNLWNEWEGFKDSRGISEFDDVIREAVDDGYTIDASELFVDEVQDLYPLQQAFLENQKAVIDRLWLGGDDDQTIYEWAGADPNYFLETEGNVDKLNEKYWEYKEGYWESEGVYILDQSFRMPSQIMRLSQRCIEKVDERQEKEFKPRQDGGNFHYFKHPRMSVIEDYMNFDDTFCLFRANYQCQNFGQKLIQRGIPFEDRFKTWRPRTVRVRDAVAALHNTDQHVDGDAAAELIDQAASDQFTGNNAFGSLEDDFRSVPQASVEELEDAINGRRVNRDRLTELVESLDDDNFNYYQKQAIMNNVFNGREHLSPDGIVVETIHWSKGQEADTVVLGLDTTTAVGSQAEEEKVMPDAERRLYYVGMTRTENKLVMGERLAGSGATFTAEDLFGEDWAEVVE